MSQTFNYRHLYYFWIVAQEGSMVKAAQRLGLSLPTISNQVRELEKDLGVSLLKLQGRSLVLTEAGSTAAREASGIFALGETLTTRVRDAGQEGHVRLNIGISDGIAKLAVHRNLAPVLHTPGLRLLCHEGEFEDLLGELARHKLHAVLSDRAPSSEKSALRIVSTCLSTSPVSWYASSQWDEQARQNFPASLAQVPVLLPTGHSVLRERLDLWFERERIKPKLVGEFEDSALMMTFGSAGMGIFPAALTHDSDLLHTYGLHPIATWEDVREEFHLIYTARKVQHPLIKQLIEAKPASP